MGYKELLAFWCGVTEHDMITIITDAASVQLAREISNDIGEQCQCVEFTLCDDIYALLSEHGSLDLIIVLLSIDTYISGANRYFSPFEKPKQTVAKYAFMRLGISGKSLHEGLMTPFDDVQARVDSCDRYADGETLHVRAPAGTDIVLQVGKFETCNHRIISDGGMAFLPPSETSAEVAAGSANGRIIVDVTVGQMYYNGGFLGEFGLVDQPVVITVEDGYVTAISGGTMASELREKLFSLPEKCRELVELGCGLSEMTAVGLIGVDESMISTCHFGIGDGIYGLHLDIVVNNPHIEVCKRS